MPKSATRKKATAQPETIESIPEHDLVGCHLPFYIFCSVMAAFRKLENTDFSVLLLEHGETADDCLPVWSFPSATPQIQHLACARCAQSKGETPFVYFKYKSDWVYCLTMPTAFRGIPSGSVCVISKNFNPEKWFAVLQVLFEQYSSSSNSDPTKILEGYLSLITTGHFSNAAGTVALASFADVDATSNQTQTNTMKDLVSMLGIEAVVLWNAVLLKKRILVLSDSASKLFPVLRTLPLLAPVHRRDFTVLRPLVSADQEYHIEDLQSAGVWIAGTTDTDMAGHSTVDVLLNLSERRVIVTTHAVAEMKMCAAHREVAAIMNELAESGSSSSSSADMIEAVGKKTADILSSLRAIGGEAGKLSEAAINARVTNEASQQWLLRLAGAEGLV